MKIYSITDVGRQRLVNQDAVFVSESPVGNLPNLFILADGMGGHNGGSYASINGIRLFVESIQDNEQYHPRKLFSQAILHAHESLKESASKDRYLEGMGTTLVAMTIIGRFAYIASVGDSRGYLIDKNQDEIRQVTKDHTYVQVLLDHGYISKEAARTHPDRNKIIQAVGAGKNVNMDFFEIPISPNQYILLCSDGLTNMIGDKILLEVTKEHEDLEKRCQVFVEMANAKGGEDNISLIMVEPFCGEELRC